MGSGFGRGKFGVCIYFYFFLCWGVRMPTKKNVFISGETFPLHIFFLCSHMMSFQSQIPYKNTVIYTRKSKTLNCELNKPAKQEH